MQPSHELSPEAFLAAIAAGDVKVLRSCKERWLELGLVAGMVKAAEYGKLEVIKLFLRQSNRAQRLVIDNAGELMSILVEYGNKKDRKAVIAYLQQYQGPQLSIQLDAVFNDAAYYGYAKALDFFLTNYQAVLPITSVSSAFEMVVHKEYTQLVAWFMAKFGADPNHAHLDLPSLLPGLLEHGYEAEAVQLAPFMPQYGDMIGLDPKYALALLLAKIDSRDDVTRFYPRNALNVTDYDSIYLRVALFCSPEFPLAQRQRLLRKLIKPVETSDIAAEIVNILIAVIDDSNTQVEILEWLLLDEEVDQALLRVLRYEDINVNKIKDVINHPNMPPGYVQNLVARLIQPAADGSFTQVKVSYALLCAIASDNQTPPEILRALTVPGPYGLLDNAQVDAVVLAAVAGNTSTPADALQRLVKPQAEGGILDHKSVDYSVLVALASNTSTPPEVLKCLIIPGPQGISDHEKMYICVLEGLVSNTKPDIDILTQLLQLDAEGNFVDPRRRIQYILRRIVENPKMPPVILRQFVIPTPNGIYGNHVFSQDPNNLKYLAKNTNASAEIFQRLVTPPPGGIFTAETRSYILQGLAENPHLPIEIAQQMITPPPQGIFNAQIMNEQLLKQLVDNHPSIVSDWKRFVLSAQEGGIAGINNHHDFLLQFASNEKAPPELLQYCFDLVNDVIRVPGELADHNNRAYYAARLLTRVISNPNIPAPMLQRSIAMFPEIMSILARAIGDPNAPAPRLQQSGVTFKEYNPDSTLDCQEGALWQWQNISSDFLSALAAAEARLTISQKQQMLKLVLGWIEQILEALKQKLNTDYGAVLEDKVLVFLRYGSGCGMIYQEFERVINRVRIDNILNQLFHGHLKTSKPQDCFLLTRQQEQMLSQATSDNKSLLRAAFLADGLMAAMNYRFTGVHLNFWQQVSGQLQQYQKNLLSQYNLQLRRLANQSRQIKKQNQQVEQEVQVIKKALEPVENKNQPVEQEVRVMKNVFEPGK